MLIWMSRQVGGGRWTASLESTAGAGESTASAARGAREEKWGGISEEPHLGAKTAAFSAEVLVCKGGRRRAPRRKFSTRMRSCRTCVQTLMIMSGQLGPGRVDSGRCHEWTVRQLLQVGVRVRLRGVVWAVCCMVLYGCMLIQRCMALYGAVWLYGAGGKA